jgi:uncharacterized protein (TIGR02266 family)
MKSRRKILVVDDSSLFRELEARFLATSGHVITAQTGAEALELARRERPEVVVAEFDLSDIEGDALCKEIKGDASLGGTPVILVTNSVDPESRARAIRAGADDVIAKPIERLALIERVSRFLSVPVARALVRVPLSTPVRIVRGAQELQGCAWTVSRGGIFVETDCGAPPGAELELQFQLPDGDVWTTARVVWRREDAPNATALPDGIGLQFLRMDGETARRIEQFVHERAPRRMHGSARA